MTIKQLKLKAGDRIWYSIGGKPTHPKDAAVGTVRTVNGSVGDDDEDHPLRVALESGTILTEKDWIAPLTEATADAPPLCSGDVEGEALRRKTRVRTGSSVLLPRRCLWPMSDGKACGAVFSHVGSGSKNVKYCAWHRETHHPEHKSQLECVRALLRTARDGEAINPAALDRYGICNRSLVPDAPPAEYAPEFDGFAPSAQHVRTTSKEASTNGKEAKRTAEKRAAGDTGKQRVEAEGVDARPQATPAPERLAQRGDRVEDGRGPDSGTQCIDTQSAGQRAGCSPGPSNGGRPVPDSAQPERVKQGCANCGGEPDFEMCNDCFDDIVDALDEGDRPAIEEIAESIIRAAGGRRVMLAYIEDDRGNRIG